MKNQRVTKKLLSTLCAATLVVGLAPTALAARSCSDLRAEWFKRFADRLVDAGCICGTKDDPSTETPGSSADSGGTGTDVDGGANVDAGSNVDADTSADAQDAKALINEVVRLTNLERAKAGLPALETFDLLDEAAAIRASEITELFSHTRPDGRTCFTALGETGANQDTYARGENIAAGNATPAATVEQWMNSPGHRANILNENYTHIGVGYVEGGLYRHSWVQMFVARR